MTLQIGVSYPSPLDEAGATEPVGAHMFHHRMLYDVAGVRTWAVDAVVDDSHVDDSHVDDSHVDDNSLMILRQ